MSELSKNITLSVSWKDEREIAKKIVKIHYLLSFLKNSGRNNFLAMLFVFFTSLFLIFLFFWVYITHLWVFSSQYLWSDITKTAYVYKKQNWVIIPILNKKTITDCGNYFCIDTDWAKVEKPIIDSFVIFEFPGF